MAKRAYGLFCGLSRALELVGERWALLIIRDLLVGPKRFTDLHRGMPKIPTNILSTRLRELEANGIVRRAILPRPSNAIVYELTEYGRDLDVVVMGLGKWGARSLRPYQPGDVFSVDTMVYALQSTFRPEVAGSDKLSVEVRIGDVVYHVKVADGHLETGAGPLPGADLVVSSDVPLRPLFAGEVSAEQALEEGRVQVVGEVDLFHRFIDMFTFHSLAATPTD